MERYNTLSNPYTNYNHNNSFMNTHTFQQHNALQNIGAFRTGSLQGDYDSHVRIEVMNNKNTNINADIDNSYENDIINNTIESTSKAHLITRNNDIRQNEKGEFVYNQNVPVANNVHELSQKLYSQIHKMDEFNVITVEDIRNLMFRENITEWTKSSIKDFVKKLKYFTQEKSEFMKNIHSSQSLQIQGPPPSIVNPIQEQINNQNSHLHTFKGSNTYIRTQSQPITIDLHNMNMKQHFEMNSVIDKSIGLNQEPRQNVPKQPDISNSKFQNDNFEKPKDISESKNIESILNLDSKMQSSKTFEISHGKNGNFIDTIQQNRHYLPQNQVRNRNPFMNRVDITAPKDIIELTINSDDRNTALYDSPFDFKILFEKEQPNEDNIKGVIYQPLENVVNIEVTSLTIPKNNIDNIGKYPYLLLIIPELGHSGIGSNQWLNKSIGKLYFTEKSGNFYIHTDRIHKISKNYKSPINLSSLSIQIRKPNGELWSNVNINDDKDGDDKEYDNINDSVSEDINELPLIIELKVTIERKEIRNINIMNSLQSIQ